MGRKYINELSFISLLIAAFTLTAQAVIVLPFGYFAIQASLRAYMEYQKGIKKEKECIIPFVWAIGYAVIFIGSILFFPGL